MLHQLQISHLLPNVVFDPVVVKHNKYNFGLTMICYSLCTLYVFVLIQTIQSKYCIKCSVKTACFFEMTR